MLNRTIHQLKSISPFFSTTGASNHLTNAFKTTHSIIDHSKSVKNTFKYLHLHPSYLLAPTHTTTYPTIYRPFGERPNSRGRVRSQRGFKQNTYDSKKKPKNIQTETNLSFNNLKFVSSIYTYLEEKKIYAPTPI
jgi:DEAD/DEAH box helicase